MVETLRGQLRLRGLRGGLDLLRQALRHQVGPGGLERSAWDKLFLAVVWSHYMFENALQRIGASTSSKMSWIGTMSEVTLRVLWTAACWTMAWIHYNKKAKDKICEKFQEFDTNKFYKQIMDYDIKRCSILEGDWWTTWKSWLCNRLAWEKCERKSKSTRRLSLGHGNFSRRKNLKWNGALRERWADRKKSMACCCCRWSPLAMRWISNRQNKSSQGWWTCQQQSRRLQDQQQVPWTCCRSKGRFEIEVLRRLEGFETAGFIRCRRPHKVHFVASAVLELAFLLRQPVWRPSQTGWGRFRRCGWEWVLWGDERALTKALQHFGFLLERPSSSRGMDLECGNGWNSSMPPRQGPGHWLGPNDRAEPILSKRKKWRTCSTSTILQHLKVLQECFSWPRALVQLNEFFFELLVGHAVIHTVLKMLSGSSIHTGGGQCLLQLG